MYIWMLPIILRHALYIPLCAHIPQVHSEYSVLFEDTTYPEGYSPPLGVPQRYVLPMRETKRR